MLSVTKVNFCVIESTLEFDCTERSGAPTTGCTMCLEVNFLLWRRWGQKTCIAELFERLTEEALCKSDLALNPDLEGGHHGSIFTKETGWISFPQFDSYCVEFHLVDIWSIPTTLL